jgi:hypothetical protein
MARDATIGAYRANAACAEFSRAVALQIFGGGRPFGYAFGGSGGSLRTIGSIENTDGIWDGVVPYVMPTPISIPNSFTSAMLASRILKDKLPDLVDALSVGSNKSVDEVLETQEQKEAYREISAMGFPSGAWRVYPGAGGLGAFALIYPSILMIDPSFVTDFWSKPGYEGYNPHNSLKEARVQLSSKIEKLITAKEAVTMGLNYDPFNNEARGLADNAWKALLQKEATEGSTVAVVLDKVPTDKSNAYDCTVDFGNGNPQKLGLQRIEDNILIFALGSNDAVNKLKVGDNLKFDNSGLLAVQYYHRHQVPGKEYAVYDQYRNEKGEPKYPQRPMLLGPLFAAAASGSVPTGKFKGKMIIVQNMNDGGAFPWHADWYRSRAKFFLGDEVDRSLRIWFTDHANHGDYPSQPEPTKDIVYLGVLQQALRDLSAWVETGIEPPLSTDYKVNNGQVTFPENAKLRGGIQPVATVKANGKIRAEIKAGHKVMLEAEIEAPENTGKIVSAAWNFEGGKEFIEVENTQIKYYTYKRDKAKIKTIHTFKKSGTYFPTLLVVSQRQGDAQTPFARIQNLGSVRVVVK